MKILKFLSFLLSFSIFSNIYAQNQLVLTAEKMKFDYPFQIENVKNSSLQKDILGSIFVSTSKKEAITLKGGTLNAVKKMLAQALPPSTSTVRILYDILDLKITETRLSNGNITGEMSLQISFKRIGKKDTISLTETTLSTAYLRSENTMEMSKYATLLTPLFIKSLTFFDKWLVLNGSKHEALVNGVKIVFLPELTKNTADTINYHSRKVTWDDFRGKPTNSRYGAAIFANFAYGSSFRVSGGLIEAIIQTQTYMVCGMSWVTPFAREDYSLAHEQLHFDITHLVVQRFRKKIAAMKAETVDDLNSMIQYEYLESYREMNKLQQDYDGQTQHSINKQKQAEWTEKVRKWLEEK